MNSPVGGPTPKSLEARLAELHPKISRAAHAPELLDAFVALLEEEDDRGGAGGHNI